MGFPTGHRETSDLWVEEFGPREARVGKMYTWQIRVTNLRDVPLHHVVLEQHIPANFTPSTANPTAKDANATQIEVGDLGPNEAKTVEMSGTPTQQGTLDACLSARYSPPRLCMSVAVVAPAIEAIAEGPSQADVCQDLVYRVRVTNSGSGTAHNLVLRATLPEGVQSSEGQKTIASNLGDINAKETKDFAVHLRAMQPGQITFQAWIHSDDAGDVKMQPIATNLLAPRLAVTIAGPKEEFLGSPLVYSVTVKNTGDAAATESKLRVGATPGSVSFVSAQYADGRQLSQEREGTGQDLGTLAPGEVRTINVNFRTDREGEMAFNATAVGRCAAEVTTSLKTRIRTLTAAAMEVTHDPDPVRVGTNVVYHIVAVNKGTATDHNVKVWVALPDSEQFINGTGSTAVTSAGQNIAFAVVPTLEPKQSVAWDITVKALKAQEAKVQVNMTTDSTRTPAIKVEPTKLFDVDSRIHERTNEAPQPGPIAPQPAPAPQTPNK
jgi:uncharacterized repeat protein (TIGR01451 family)